MKLSFLGAAMGVTGSSFLLETGGRKILIDCGMFQGSKAISALNRRPFAYNPAELDCILLTHAHIDHSGLLPRVCKQGFRGPIYATRGTIELCSIMLPDSAHIQEFDAEIANRKGRRMGRPPVEPLYSLDDVQTCLRQFRPVEYRTAFTVCAGTHIHFHDAGHILGSSMLEIHVNEEGKETRLLFSGDLGRPDQPIMEDPANIQAADFVIVESTYGDRDHTDIDWEEKLAEIINETVAQNGNVIIPAFAVGRTQIMLYYLNRLYKAGRIPAVPVIIDSPLAIAATEIFRRNTQYYDQESRDILKQESHGPLELPQLQLSRTAEESKAINSRNSSAIIISASGMADAGRILHHLKHNLWRPESSILFVGFQAEGSLGRRLLNGAKKVRVMGEEIGVRARIHNLDGLSAHADREDILQWLSEFKVKPSLAFLVHGEPDSARALQGLLAEKLQLKTFIPRYGDVAVISGTEWEVPPELRIASMEPAVRQLQDYLNELDSAWVEVKQRLEEIVAANAGKMPSVLSRLDKVRKFVQKTLGDI